MLVLAPAIAPVRRIKVCSVKRSGNRLVDHESIGSVITQRPEQRQKCPSKTVFALRVRRFDDANRPRAPCSGSPETGRAQIALILSRFPCCPRSSADSPFRGARWSAGNSANIPERRSGVSPKNAGTTHTIKATRSQGENTKIVAAKLAVVITC